MKGIFKDSKDWEIIIGGDWRDKNGKPSKYSKGKGTKQVFISGGLGMYWFHKGNWNAAIYCYLNELEVILKIEEEEKRRFHKGLFYYQLGLSYKNNGEEANANKYLLLAKQEDEITYGDLAKTFPATKIEKEKNAKQ